MVKSKKFFVALENKGIVELSDVDQERIKGSVDFPGFLSNKSNRNVLIVGQSGQGKSELMNYLVSATSGYHYIFSFKRDDVFFRLPYASLDLATSRLDVFGDHDAFVQSYLVAFPINSMGIMASQVPSLLFQGLNNSHDFRSLIDYFDNNKKELGSNIAVQSIINNLYVLYGSHGSVPSPVVLMDLILDFSGLNEVAKTFYAEFYLRLLWNKIILEKWDNVVLVIDEMHRIARSEHSIISDVLREIRAYGSIFCSSQNYNDLPPAISSQFSTCFVFNDQNHADLSSLSSLGLAYNRYVPFLKPHVFIDVHGSKKSISYFKLNGLVRRSDPVSVSSPGDYEKMKTFYAFVKRQGVVPEKDLLKKFGPHYCDLVSGDIRSYEVVPFGTLYFLKARNAVHEYIVNYLHNLLLSWGYDNTKTKGNNLADLILDNCFIEVETGAKHDLSDLSSRIKSYDRPCLIVVPNEKVYKRYLKKYNDFLYVGVIYITDLSKDLLLSLKF